MINDKEFEEFVFSQALENAVSFGGSPNPKALVGRCVPKFPEMKSDMGHYMNLINNICSQVSSMSAKDQKKKLTELNPEFFEKQKEKKEVKSEGLVDLPNFEGKFIGRFAPAPSGYLHIGHLRNLVFNFEYKKKYGGKFIVRFEDTNPEKIAKENYDKILDDVNWLTEGGVDEVYYQSERIPTYYKYLRQLIELSKAYVCECDPEVSKSYNDSSEACPHRSMDVAWQTDSYEKFFDGRYKDGESVIKFKGDLKNSNPALRDFSIARLNSGEHARVADKYKLWPMYNFAVSVDDSLMGVTYIIRGKDAEIGGVRQDMVKDALGLGKAPYFHFGLINFTDMELGKTPIKEKIQKGEYTGWDDPRVPTIISFRRRGFKAKAFRDMYIAMGISKRDMKMSEAEYFKQINFFNKQILEKEADRFFFVHNPKKIHITNVSDFENKEILLPRHPENKSRGSRHFKVEHDYLIDGIDFDNLEVGDMIRLMHFANFKITSKVEDMMTVEFISKDYDKSLSLKRNIHFVPVNGEKVEIVMQDNSHLKGICEDLDNIKEDSSFQFERFGFVKYDSKNDEGNKVFYFTHR